MLLTDKQIHEIKQIIEDHHSAFIVNTIGPDAVAADVLERLKKKGLVSTKVESIKDAYLYGQALAAAQDPRIAKMSYDEFKEWLTKNPVRLSPIEQHAVRMAQIQAAQYVKGLGNRVEAATGQILINADAGLRAQLQDQIRTKTAENIERRESVKRLKSDLGWASKDWARDWDRIAITEKHNAMQAGLADHFTKRYGPDVLVAKRPMPDACEHCVRLHIGPDGQPRIFKLATLVANGTNHGRKAKDWQAVVGATHPNCQCQLIRVPAGWGFDKDGELTPGGSFGVHYDDESDLELAMLQEHDLQKSIATGDRLEFQGLPICIENRVGTVRKWRDAEGGTGETRMMHAYGYIEGTHGADGEEVDCYVGPDPRAEMAYVIHQQNPNTGIYDEDKVMLGFPDEVSAEFAYRAHYNRPDFLVDISPMDMEHFKRWVYSGVLQKSVEPERFVILEKASQGSATTTSEEATLDSRAGDRNPSQRGSGVNYYFEAPPRTVPPTLKDMGFDPQPDDILRPAEKRKAIKRDPVIYTMIAPVPKEPHPIEVPDHAGSLIGSGAAEHNREWLEDHARALQGAPNEAPTVRPKKKRKKRKLTKVR